MSTDKRALVRDILHIGDPIKDDESGRRSEVV